MVPTPRRPGTELMTLGRRIEMLDTSAAEPSPLTPGQALAKLFLDNADHDRHAANDVLVKELTSS
jgi:hypothetical protein